MPDMGVTEILAIVGTALSAGATGYGIYEQRQAQDQQLQAQRQAQQQAQQQEMSTRRHEMAAAAPSLQSQVGGSLTPEAFQSLTATLTGNPRLAATTPSGGAGGSLTPAMENLFPSGGVPSLTEPWPTNV